MREILFRGKRIDNGEWTYGNLIVTERLIGTECYVSSKTGIDNGKSYKFSVNPPTVGQFTGLIDKNGKKIFEGDIIVVPLSGKPAKGIVEYFKTDICGFVVITQPQYSNYVLQKNYAYEVIGNIHDNPDLLGGDDK